jgi:hypothetical protein
LSLKNNCINCAGLRRHVVLQVVTRTIVDVFTFVWTSHLERLTVNLCKMAAAVSSEKDNSLFSWNNDIIVGNHIWHKFGENDAFCPNGSKRLSFHWFRIRFASTGLWKDLAITRNDVDFTQLFSSQPILLLVSSEWSFPIWKKVFIFFIRSILNNPFNFSS